MSKPRRNKRVDANRSQNGPGGKPGGDPPDAPTHPSDVPTATGHEDVCTCRPDQAPAWKTMLEIGAIVIGFTALFIYNGQLGEMRKQTAAAQASVAEIQKQTEISERPWLSVEVTPGSDLYWVDTPSGKYPALAFKVSIKNLGKSIAKNVQVDLKLFASNSQFPFDLDAIKKQRELCDHPHPEQVGWFDLFPTDQPIVQTLSTSVTTSDVLKAAVPVQGKNVPPVVGLYFVGCLTYRSSYGSELHQTHFGFHVVGPIITSKDGRPLALTNGFPVMGAFEVGKRVPKKEVGFMRELFSMNDAD